MWDACFSLKLACNLPSPSDDYYLLGKAGSLGFWDASFMHKGKTYPDLE